MGVIKMEDERIKCSWIQTSGTGRSYYQCCEEEGCNIVIDKRKTVLLFGKMFCSDCRYAYESVMADMKHEQKMYEYFTFEEIMGLN